MSYFKFEDKNVFYTESGSGTPLLLLHGNTASSNMFVKIVEKYEKEFRVILIDFLGHGKSDRLPKFPADLWFYEAEQVIAFLKEKQYEKVDLIGTSGGALVAINVALEVPELVNKVIADSFEGEKPIKEVTDHIEKDREESKHHEDSVMFYDYMHGSDWEQIVDHDTDAIVRNKREIGKFFHKELGTLKPDILFTGSLEDEFVSTIAPDYFEKTYGDMIAKIGHGKLQLLKTGGHPALLSNPDDFYQISLEFLKGSTAK